ncbi:hypothetical protein HRbin27_00788 [bacterium HR27]|nr:hypothetical protein HRbin27_00788 [bacterium HR27]
MPRTESTVAPAERIDCGEAHLGQLSEMLARLYRLWLGLAVALLTVGLVLDLFEDGNLEQATVSLTNLPSELMRGQPVALETAALLFVALGPVTGLLVMLGACARRGDRRTTALVVVVLLVVAALPITRLVGGH